MISYHLNHFIVHLQQLYSIHTPLPIPPPYPNSPITTLRRGLWLFPNCNIALYAMMDGGSNGNGGGDEYSRPVLINNSSTADENLLLSSPPPSTCTPHIILTLKLLNKQSDITHSAFRRLSRPNLFYPTLSIQRRNLVTGMPL